MWPVATTIGTVLHCGVLYPGTLIASWAMMHLQCKAQASPLPHPSYPFWGAGGGLHAPDHMLSHSLKSLPPLGRVKYIQGNRNRKCPAITGPCCQVPFQSPAVPCPLSPPHTETGAFSSFRFQRHFSREPFSQSHRRPFRHGNPVSIPKSSRLLSHRKRKWQI